MLTSQQIIQLACHKAKTPGMLQIAGQFMNAALLQVALDQNLDIIRRSVTINLLTGKTTYDLPAGYLRIREVFYPIDGEVFIPTAISLDEYDALFKGPGEIGYPYHFATDIGKSPPTISVYPAPSTSLVMTIRYMDNLVEIATPENSSVIPWFQDQLLLIDMIAQNMLDINDDGRAAEFYQKNDDKFRRLLQSANDKGGRAVRVIKDPNTFRSVRNIKPTKLLGD